MVSVVLYPTLNKSYLILSYIRVERARLNSLLGDNIFLNGNRRNEARQCQTASSPLAMRSVELKKEEDNACHEAA